MRVVAGQQPVVGERPGQWGRTFSAREAATAERVVETARAELTDRILIFGERHLHTVLARYSAHLQRPAAHRTLRLQPPRPDHPASDLARRRTDADRRCEG
jgi:hypothetical protein